MSAPGTWGVFNFSPGSLNIQQKPNQQTASYTLLATDFFVQFNTTTPVIATLNSALTPGTTYRIKNISLQSVTVKATTGDIDQTLGTTGVVLGQWNSLDITLDPSNNWNIL